jgi:hypothetical protein
METVLAFVLAVALKVAATSLATIAVPYFQALAGVTNELAILNA